MNGLPDAASIPGRESVADTEKHGDAPARPLARRLGNHVLRRASVAVWALRNPSRLIGTRADLSLPFAPVWKRLVPPLLVIVSVSYGAGLLVHQAVDRSVALDRISSLAFYGLGLVGDLALQAACSTVLAWMLLAWWRVEFSTRRLWDAAAVIGVSGAVSQVVGHALGIGHDILVRFVADDVSVMSDGVRFAVTVLTAAVAGWWAYRIVRDVTPAADRGALVVLLIVVIGCESAIAFQLAEAWWSRALSPLYFWIEAMTGGAEF